MARRRSSTGWTGRRRPSPARRSPRSATASTTRPPAGCATPVRATHRRCWSPATSPGTSPAGGSLTGGRSRPLAAATGPRADATVDVPPGSVLLWYSDGLVERRDTDLDAGLDLLASVASRFDGESPQTWCDTVIAELTGGQ